MLNKNIKALRKAKGLSQEELAIKLNVVRQTVSKWEKGLSVPDAGMVIQIAEVLDTTVNVLLGEEIPSSEEPDFIKTLAAKLEVLNEQYSKQDERRRKIWRMVFAVILIVSAASLIRYLIFFTSIYQMKNIGDASASTSVTVIGGINYRDIPSTDCLRRGNYGPFCNGKYSGKTIKEIKESCKLSVWGNVDNWPVICFDTSDECVNFFNCTDTVCYHFLSYAFTNDQNVPIRFLPWLGDAINPRTGLKGYTGEWTDEDLALYFGITPEEQEEIEMAMKKYAVMKT